MVPSNGDSPPMLPVVWCAPLLRQLWGSAPASALELPSVCPAMLPGACLPSLLPAGYVPDHS